MAASCPVCDAPFSDGEEHCPRCGFPAALRGRLDGPVPEPPNPEDDAIDRPVGRAGRASSADGPEAEVNATIARGLEERTELLRTIDRDAPDVTGELCEAALNEAAGRASDAQQILRSAQRRLDRETEELLARHLESLEARGGSLASAGLRLALEGELTQLAETIVAGTPAVSVAALATAERRLDSIESHWRGLQALIEQVGALRGQAEALGVPLPTGPDRLAQARANLATLPVTERDLDAVAQIAAQSLMRLHEAIPPALELELGEHEATLGRHAGRGGPAASARRRHAEALAHLRGGRLEEALRSVRELRAELDELARTAAARPPPPEPGPTGTVGPVGAPVRSEPVEIGEPASTADPSRERAPDTAPAIPPPRAPPELPGAPSQPAPAPRTPAPRAAIDPVVVGALMKKARSLAARVRTLPPNSEEAATAARQIHEATELLRAGKYEEADAALSRLMRTLISTAPPT